MYDKYFPFRKWFFNNLNKEQQQLYKTLFYEYIYVHERVIPFVIWFYDQYEQDFPSICAIDTFYKKWKTISRETVRSIHPLTESLKIDFENNRNLETNTFYPLMKQSNYSPYATLNDINKVLKQNNYTNLYIQTIGSQLIRMEETLDKIQTVTKETKPPDKLPNISTAYIKPSIELSKGFNLGSSTRNKQIIDILFDKLNKLY